MFGRVKHFGVLFQVSRRLMSNSSVASLLKKPELFQSQNFINGEFVNALCGKTMKVIDPGNESVLGEVSYGTGNDAELAIEKAVAVFPVWKSTPIEERCRLVREFGEQMLVMKHDLGVILSKEGGKPLSEAIGEIVYAANFFVYYGTNGVSFLKSQEQEQMQTAGPKDPVDVVVTREAIGVAACITPWNFPSAMITRKASAALVAGCPCIFKPDHQTPYSALALGVIANQIGLPPGVLQVVVGESASIGTAFLSSKAVKKVSFTGSTSVGKKLYTQGAETIKKLSLELGGNAPVLVFDDADVDLAVKHCMNAKFRNAGQTCVAANRFFIQAGIYDAFASKLTAEVAALKVGYGLDEGVQIGSLINAQGVEKVTKHVKNAVDNGATVLTGGKALGGNFYAPTVLGDCKPTMQCFQDETFGPVASLTKFTDVDLAIEMANDTDMGLASYVFSGNAETQQKVSDALQFGMVAINTGGVSRPLAPFGGIKQSGFGREGSKLGLEEYLQIKTKHIGRE